MESKFSGDLTAEIRQLRSRVEALEARLGQQTALTTASAGWVLPAMDADPPTPSSGGHIYGSGEDVMVRLGNGDMFALAPPPDIPVGASVSQPPVFNSPSAPASVTVSVYQSLRDDCQTGLRATLIALINSLRNAGIIQS